MPYFEARGTAFEANGTPVAPGYEVYLLIDENADGLFTDETGWNDAVDSLISATGGFHALRPISADWIGLSSAIEIDGQIFSTTFEVQDSNVQGVWIQDVTGYLLSIKSWIDY